MEFLSNADFWIGLVKIVWINIILSGDNAVVIALAARSLPPEQQKKAVMFGSGAAVVLRIVLTIVAAKLLELSFLQIVGGCLLLWIGYQLLTGDEDDEPAVANLVARLLAKAPEARYQKGAELARDLRACQAAIPANEGDVPRSDDANSGTSHGPECDFQQTIMEFPTSPGPSSHGRFSDVL